MSNPLWSILIPTLAWREDKFLPLVNELISQAEAYPGKIEVVALQNAGGGTIDSYRETLLRDAKGKYLSFVDDDDIVMTDYVPVILKAMEKDPDVVTFGQHCTGTGASITLFGLGYLGAPYEPLDLGNSGMAYLRPYSHVLPTRSEIAKQASFLNPDGPAFTGEDYAFVSKVVPILMQRGAREARTDRVLYWYRWDANDSTQNGKVPPEVTAHWADHPRPQIDSECFRWCE